MRPNRLTLMLMTKETLTRLLCAALIVLINGAALHGQNNQTDTSQLPKYSYLIYGHASSGNSVQATGFFVGKNERVYLVTACHVINGWLFESFKKTSYPDTLFVKVALKEGLRDTALAIDISKIKYSHADPELPDIYFLSVNIPSNCKIYRLDSLISNYRPITRIPKAMFAFGFVINDDELRSRQIFRSGYKKAVAFIPDWDEYACSPFIYEVGYYNNDLGPGDSGAPVYFLAGNTTGGVHSELVFGGLIFGGNRLKHRASVIRAEVVIALFNELGKR